MSMGGVELLQRIQEMYAQAGHRLTSHPVSPLRFFPSQADKSTVFALEKSYLTFEC